MYISIFLTNVTHIIRDTDFLLFCSNSARKCLILPAECSPQKSLILLEILPAEFIQAYCWGVGRIFTQVQCLKFTRSHFSVNAKKGFEKSSRCANCCSYTVFLIFTLRFVDQSHARLFVEIYIRACDKFTIFSKYARAPGVQVATPLILL